MAKTVTEKIGVRENMRTIFINAPADTIKEISSPTLDLKKKLTGKFDYIHFFVRSQAEFHKKFPKLMNYLQHPGMLWVSWPKSGFKGTDLNIKIIIKLGYDYGLVESKTISINSIWSAIKFTWPKEKVVYNNSYGKLKKR
jgi:hypothetical protein